MSFSGYDETATDIMQLAQMRGEVQWISRDEQRIRRKDSDE